MKLGEHFWPKAAMAFGLLAIFSGTVSHGSSGVGGFYMVIGALAYLSAKKRKLGEVEDTTLRKVLELIAIAVICYFVVITDKRELIEDPAPHLVIPIWAVIAYVVAFTKNASVEKAEKSK